MSETNETQDELTPIYTGVFLINPVIHENSAMFAISNYHVTYHYQPGRPLYPDPIICDGDWAEILHLGIYDDGEILASKVCIVNPGVISSDTESTKIIPIERYQHERYLENSKRERVNGIPLHITWSTKDLPPVIAGERLKDHENAGIDNPDYLKYYTPNDELGIYTKKSIMIANDLDYKNIDDKISYHKRIKPIFNHLNSMGIWKTVKSKPEKN
tara:strand:- start:2542 stop:3186 length:645 start_codon:yes stop_codon:yes gene_type:complete